MLRKLDPSTYSMHPATERLMEVGLSVIQPETKPIHNLPTFGAFRSTTLAWMLNATSSLTDNSVPCMELIIVYPPLWLQ
jgi:hypothetical protein